MNFSVEGQVCLREIGEGGGFGFEGGNGFDEASDGEGVADAAGTADEAEDSAFACQLDGDAYQGGDAGAVNLRDTVEDDNDFFGTGLDHRFEGVVELLGRLADGEAAVNFEDRDSSRFADVDFHGGTVSHGNASIYPSWATAAIGKAARHYTLEGKLHKGNRCRSLPAELSWDRGERRIRKTNRGHANFKL